MWVHTQQHNKLKVQHTELWVAQLVQVLLFI
jgi:hypothetical protein